MPYSLNLIWVTSLISLAQCSPAVQPRIYSNVRARQADNCHGLQAIPNSDCWDTLKITEYLNNPTTGWAKTTPTCPAGSQGSDCCLSGEAWSTCFLRLAGGTTHAECTAIDQGVCQGQFDYPSLAPGIRAQIRYVVGAIVAIYGFFASLDHSEFAIEYLDC